MKKTTRSFLQKPSTTGLLIGVLAVAFGVVGLLLVQTPLEKPQDVRRQASIDAGQVTVSRSISPSTVSVGTETTVYFGVNTAGIPTDGIQVLFNVITNSFDSLTADIETSTGLQSAGTQVERTADGFLVQALALPAQIGQPFTTTGDISPIFLRVKFTPTKTGKITFNFDREESISILHKSNPLEDKLRHIENFEITVQSQPGASPNPSPSVTPSPSPSPSPAVGGIKVVGCNVECTSNAQCGINQRCYAVDGTSRCRLAVNPTNDRCQTADAGPNRRCNQGCADTHECAAGLTCWYNQCRHPLNVESSTCAALTQTETQNLAASCNKACTVNADCDINLRCYQGACRLATNPSSSTCSAAISPTISSTYAAPKGGAATATDSATTKNTESDADTAATTAGTPADSDNQTPDEQNETVLDRITAETDVIKNESALDVLLSMMKTPDSALPLIVIGAGVGLLILALIIILLRRMLGGSPSGSTIKTATPATHSIKKEPEPTVQRNDLGTPLTTARSMTTPTASMPTQHTLEQSAARSQVVPPAATTSTVDAAPDSESSMLQRMKNKGITLPKGTTEPPKQS